MCEDTTNQQQTAQENTQESVNAGLPARRDKRLNIPSEITYFISIIILAFAVAMLSSADFGLSMIVATPYILSQKIDFLTFGMAEYVVQGILFIVLCILVRRIKITYFFAFVTCLIYGAVLDLWRMIIPAFNPSVTPPGSMELWVRIVFFIIGVGLTSFSVALSFKTYLYPQVNDFIVKAVTNRFKLNVTIVKYSVDAFFLITSLIFSFALFGNLVGIGWGSLIMFVPNAFLIGLFSKMLDKLFTFKPLCKKLANKFNDI